MMLETRISEEEFLDQIEALVRLFHPTPAGYRAAELPPGCAAARIAVSKYLEPGSARHFKDCPLTPAA
jgi:hypothetical protein